MIYHLLFFTWKKHKTDLHQKKIVNHFFEISKILKTLNINVKYVATDGDISFDKCHQNFFDDHILPIIEDTFENIVESLSDLSEIPLSDPLHLFKNERARALLHLMMVDPDECRCLNMKLFEIAANLGPVFYDKSKAASMKDVYALLMFSWNTLVSALNSGRFDAAFFILPFVYLAEAIESPLLSKEMRINFLSFSFQIFKYHFQTISKIGSKSLFTQRFKKKNQMIFMKIHFAKKKKNLMISLDKLIMKMKTQL